MEEFSWAKEVKRQAVHMSGLLVAVAYLSAGKSIALALTLAGLGASLLVSQTFKRGNPLAGKIVDKLERKEAREKFPVQGAIFFFLGVGLSILLFSPYLAPAIILIITIGDAFSTLVGLRWGSVKLPYNSKKSLQGSMGFLVSSFIATSFLLPYQLAFVGSLVGALAESFSKGSAEDNIFVPLLSGLVMQLSLCSGIV